MEELTASEERWPVGKIWWRKLRGYRTCLAKMPDLNNDTDRIFDEVYVNLEIRRRRWSVNRDWLRSG